MESVKVKQSWEPGSRVNIGGREYFVQGREDTAPKGLARAYILATADQSRRYRWRPFRGLELLEGELVRPRRRRKPKAPTGQGRTQMKDKVGLWNRLKAHFGRRVKPHRNVTITRAPGATNDHSQRQG